MARRSYVFNRPSPAGIAGRYAVLVALLLLAIFPFVWQLSTSLKGPYEDIYSFPPELLPGNPTLANYAQVTRQVPVLLYAWHSALVGFGTVASNVVFATLAGYALGCLRFRGRNAVLVLLISTMLFPGEVTLTSQFLTINSLGLANTLVGVFLPGAVGAINVLLMTTACRSIPAELLDAAIMDGAGTLQRIRHVVWPSVRGMVAVVALFAFIGAWDDFLWPLVVLSDPDNYTLTVGLQYLSGVFQSNPRVVAAGTIIALLPIIALFVVMQRFFFRGIEQGGIKG